WTAREVDWGRLLQIHHRVRPKPKGKPTYRLVPQKTGGPRYRRGDGRRAPATPGRRAPGRGPPRRALAEGLAGKLPASWRHAEENAAVEVWLTIHEATAVCGFRLSGKSMRHRNHKNEPPPASVRPTVAAAMVRLAEIKPEQVVV